MEVAPATAVFKTEDNSSTTDLSIGSTGLVLLSSLLRPRQDTVACRSASFAGLRKYGACGSELGNARSWTGSSTSASRPVPSVSTVSVSQLPARMEADSSCTLLATVVSDEVLPVSSLLTMPAAVPKLSAKA